jgi:hypothetical protein
MATLSRRTLLAAGGTSLLALASAAFWQRRRAVAARRSAHAQAESAVGYADHRGWMVTADEKQKLSPSAARAIP